MIETPNGTLTIELSWITLTGVTANMTLYGADGWKADTRYWAEDVEHNPERDEDGSLAQVISEWTGVAAVEAEAFVEDTVSHWRASSEFEYDIKISRWTKQLMAVLAVVAVFALVGVAAVIWLVVSALT